MSFLKALRFEKLSVKLMNAAERAATKANQPVEEFSKSKLEEPLLAITQTIPAHDDVVGQLEAFRQSLEPSTWIAVSNNPGLQEMAKDYWNKCKRDAITKIADKIKEVLASVPEEITPEEIDEFIQLQLG